VYSFQNEENLYMVMEYMKGGDVGSVLATQYCFNNETAKFALAHIVAALEYLQKH
jgi:serine/threonine protein kinase